jgi:molybdate transport system regulatory protein
MNRLQGDITEFVRSGDLSLVKIKSGKNIFTSLAVHADSNDSFLATGKIVNIEFKETEVMIALPGPMEISVQNRIPCRIKSIQEGKILCQVLLEFDDREIISIITCAAAGQLRLKPEDLVIALIKTNEVSLSYQH